MEKQKITGSEALLKSLIAEGVDTIFGYPGGQAIPIYDSLYDYRDKLKHVLVRHEQGATHAAHLEGKRRTWRRLPKTDAALRALNCMMA